MRLRTQLAALALAGSSVACSTMAPAPTKDFGKLTEKETADFVACATEGLVAMPAERVVKDLTKIAEQDPSVAMLLINPQTQVPLVIAYGMTLANKDCAEKMGIDPKTVPPVQLNIAVQDGPSRQTPAPRNNRRDNNNLI